jgi:colanic acid/amylovoran biosynthesis glycosyltransferase
MAAPAVEAPVAEPSGAVSGTAGLRLGYLVGRYPAISHTFIMREVKALRRLGVDVETMSIWRTAPEKLLAAADREEAASTFAALPAGPWRVLRSQLAACSARPARYFATLMKALRLSPGGVRSRLRHLAYFVEAILCWQHCRVLGIRHVHAQFSGNAATAALLIAHLERGSSRPFGWSMAVHGPVEFYDVSTNRLAEKARDADFLVCISDFARSQLMALVPETQWSKIHVVHCGVDPSVFAAGPAPEEPTRRNHGLEILAVGRLVGLKGHGVLLEALARLRTREVPARLTIVGDGPRREALESRTAQLGLSNCVRFTGAVGQDQIRDYYRDADVFCLPSFGEGVPVVLMEAMAMGVPVVTSRIAGIPELVEDGVGGLLTAPGRPDQVADAIEALWSDPDLRRRMGVAGREKVVAEFDVAGAAEQLATIYASEIPAPAPVPPR